MNDVHGCGIFRVHHIRVGDFWRTDRESAQSRHESESGCVCVGSVIDVRL